MWTQIIINGTGNFMLNFIRPLFFILISYSVIAGNNLNSYLENDWDRTKSELGVKSALWAGGWLSGMYLLSYQDECLNDAVKPLYKNGFKYYFDTVDYLGYGPYIVPTLFVFTGATFLFNDQKLRHAALTSVESVLATSAIVYVLKISAGRYRPYQDRGPHFFEPFTYFDASFPSGHTSTAFAIMMPFAVYYDNFLSYALLTLPASTAISRMIFDKHWATDVLTGGAIGCVIGYYLAKWHKDFSKNQSPNSSTPVISFSIPL